MSRSRWLVLGALLSAATAAQLCWIHERRDRFIPPHRFDGYVSFHAEVPPGDEVHVLDHTFRLLGASLTIREAFQVRDGQAIRAERDWVLPLPALAGLVTLLPALVGAFVGRLMDRIPWCVGGSAPTPISRRTAALCAGLTLVSSGIAAGHASTDVRSPAEAARQALLTIESREEIPPRAISQAMSHATPPIPHRGYLYGRLRAVPSAINNKFRHLDPSLAAWPAEPGREGDVLVFTFGGIFARRLPSGAPLRVLPSEEELQTQWRRLPED